MSPQQACFDVRSSYLSSFSTDRASSKTSYVNTACSPASWPCSSWGGAPRECCCLPAAGLTSSAFLTDADDPFCCFELGCFRPFLPDEGRGGVGEDMLMCASASVSVLSRSSLLCLASSAVWRKKRSAVLKQKRKKEKKKEEKEKRKKRCRCALMRKKNLFESTLALPSFLRVGVGVSLGFPFRALAALLRVRPC